MREAGRQGGRKDRVIGRNRRNEVENYETKVLDFWNKVRKIKCF